FGNTIGNLRTFYASFSNVTIGGNATNGVFLGTNQDINFQNTTLTQLAASGGAGYVNNQFVDVATNTLIGVHNNTATPSNRGQGRIGLASLPWSPPATLPPPPRTRFTQAGSTPWSPPPAMVWTACTLPRTPVSTGPGSRSPRRSR